MEEMHRERDASGEPVVILPAEAEGDRPGKVLLREFVTANKTCAECGASPVMCVPCPHIATSRHQSSHVKSYLI
jgi:hypothetical protein